MKKNSTSQECYYLYRKTVENPVSLSEFRQIVGEYHKFLINKILEGEKVTLPNRLGTLEIKGRKQKVKFDEEGKIRGLAPDWVETKKLWGSNSEAKAKKQLVYHTNAHTDGIRYRFCWSKDRVLITNKTLYSLIISRPNKRAVHKLITEGQEYISN